MNKTLWVDDIRNPPNSDFTVVRTYADAIKQLETDQYDVIWLDHDLGDFSNGREYTGYDVVLWLCERKHNGGVVPNLYNMLTSNPVGRTNMIRLIRRHLI